MKGLHQRVSQAMTNPTASITLSGRMVVMERHWKVFLCDTQESSCQTKNILSGRGYVVNKFTFTSCLFIPLYFCLQNMDAL